ncbi:uncharacterized protein LOC127739680 [Arachis duranensis]|uniref:Uncharacterized protein LOC127739680 n=1 Tax=Arachis duranensis TaxID=130453 RepID=A0A9C6TNL8_ARADU|nr:uncharacterized protein LOC127739680 [Arachis duranensis]
MITIANPFGIRCVLRIPNKIPIWLSVLRLALAIALPLMALFSILFLVGLLLVVFDNFSISRPISLPSQCKIVSKVLVEYKDNFSGQIQVAFAEAPNEALPLYCRPNFGAAWLAQYKFKVNETYDCWYTSGVSKVRFDQDNLFSCQADGQSALEKIKLYSNM